MLLKGGTERLFCRDMMLYVTLSNDCVWLYIVRLSEYFFGLCVMCWNLETVCDLYSLFYDLLIMDTTSRRLF